MEASIASFRANHPSSWAISSLRSSTSCLAMSIFWETDASAAIMCWIYFFILARLITNSASLFSFLTSRTELGLRLWVVILLCWFRLSDCKRVCSSFNFYWKSILAVKEISMVSHCYVEKKQAAFFFILKKKNNNVHLRYTWWKKWEIKITKIFF